MIEKRINDGSRGSYKQSKIEIDMKYKGCPVHHHEKEVVVRKRRDQIGLNKNRRRHDKVR